MYKRVEGQAGTARAGKPLLCIVKLRVYSHSSGGNHRPSPRVRILQIL
jgi:hypothetical protein